MKNKLINIFFLLSALMAGLFSPAFVFAEGLNNEAPSEPDALFGGFTAGGGMTFVLSSAKNANAAAGGAGAFADAKNPSEAAYSIDLTFENSFDENNRAFLHFETGKGSLDNYLSVFGGVNRDADDSDGNISLTEAYFEHIFGGGWSAVFGKLDPTLYLDENAFANDETTQFLGYPFRNALCVNFPDNALGARIAWESSLLALSVQYLESCSGENCGDIFKYAFISAQLNIMPDFISGLDGNYRFYAWADGNNYINEVGKEKKKYGFGFSFDQSLNDVLGVFARYSQSCGGVLNGTETEGFTGDFGLSYDWSAGLELRVPFIGRQDILGLGFAHIKASETSRNAGFGGDNAEKHAEIYYSRKLSDYFTLSPDFQIIRNPYGDKAQKTIYAFAIRAQVDL